jgi:hypothetical protein
VTSRSLNYLPDFRHFEEPSFTDVDSGFRLLLRPQKSVDSAFRAAAGQQKTRLDLLEV